MNLKEVKEKVNFKSEASDGILQTTSLKYESDMNQTHNLVGVIYDQINVLFKNLSFIHLRF